MTPERIHDFTREVDSLVIGAPSLPEMYRRLATLYSHGRGGWQLLRSPTWVGDTLVAVVIRPDLWAIEPEYYL